MTVRSSSAAAPASGEARYQIERKLGEGTAGAVYLVRDRETGEQLALKKLFRMDGKSVLRLKREFRSLQALNHPHIVRLYDMGQSGDGWFLAMEYLDGTDLTAYLNGAAGLTTCDGTGIAWMASGPAAGRLLPAFHQLARGIHSLHDAGMLHRDLKPSNVFVVDHRVVVLDFGLVRELSVAAATLTEDGHVAGTPAYMAPEQIEGHELTAASDWYAFGVMLYEAVSGLLPIDGPMLKLLRTKLEADPPPLRRLVPNVPAWLNDLCMALLRREPGARPCGSEILASLEAAQPSAALPTTSTEHLLHTENESQSSSRPLFGREPEIKQLWAALAQTEDGNSVVVHVRAPSGTGKTALVEHFLNQVELPRSASHSRDALVLRSRCYELEAMPFKALDGVMDALARHLSRLDDFEVGHLLPLDTPALARVFPVLERLNAVKRLIMSARSTPDPLQSRRRAESALRSLLDNMAALTPLVIWIDDLQWGDLDSARILRNWIVQPSAAPILFVFSYRSDEVATSTCLRKLLHQDAEQPSLAVEHTMDLAPLEPAEIRSLCEPRLGAATPARTELIERVVREAQGSPFLASQLIALAQAKSARGDTDLHMLTLDLMVAQTSAMLAEDAKKLLALLAVAGRPLSPKVALQACGVRRGGRALVHDLRGLNLLRTRDVAGERMLEVYHDRIRERVQGGLASEESRKIHAALLRTLVLNGESDSGWLHTLALGSGDATRALHHGNVAAERANASLAFERAASLYRTCIDLVPAADSGELWRKLSLALARCGRGVDAAEASLEVVKHLPLDEQPAWLQRAASHFLRSGHFAQGEALVRKVLEANQIDVPQSDAGLIAAIIWERARVRMRGTKDVLRTTQQAPPDVLARGDLLAELGLDTQAYDPLRAALFQVRALRCALEAGEPLRLMRALCAAAIAAALDGSARAARESDALLARATAINSRLPTPDYKPIYMARAISAFVLCRMHEVLAAAQDGERLFRADSQDDPGGNYYRRFLLASVRIGARHFFGDYAAFVPELRSMLEEAATADNRAILLQLAFSQTHGDQLSGQTSRTRARLEAQRAELPDNCFGVLHVLHMLGVISEACWSGEYTAAASYLDSAWARFLKSPVRRTAYLRSMAHEGHARFVLNQYVVEGRQGYAARAIAKDMRVLEKLPTSSAAVLRFRARLATLAGQDREALLQLRASTAAYQALEMLHEVARNEYALGVLLKGDEGSVLRSKAVQRMCELGVADAMLDMRAHYPELCVPTEA